MFTPQKTFVVNVAATVVVVCFFLEVMYDHKKRTQTFPSISRSGLDCLGISFMGSSDG